MIGGWGISCKIAFRWMSLDLTDDKSALVQVMAWCHQAHGRKFLVRVYSEESYDDNIICFILENGSITVSLRYEHVVISKPGWRQAIIWTKAVILLIVPLGINFSENWTKILTFSFKKMCLKTSSAKWQPYCPGGDELMTYLGPSFN